MNENQKDTKINIEKNRNFSKYPIILIIGILIYIIIFFFFALKRYHSAQIGDPDTSLFDQSFYTAYKYGLPFNNTFEYYNNFIGISHFGIHNSFIFYLILPFYSIYPSCITLLILQCMAMGIGAVPVYLIAKDRLDQKTALIFALMYLLYHPMHGVNYDQFNELSFSVAPLLFAVYFFLKRKFFPFWICMIILMLCKEDANFIVIFWGIYGLISGFIEKNRSSKLILNSLFMIIAGSVYLYLSLNVIIPHFYPTHVYKIYSERFSHLGNNLIEIVFNIISNPVTSAGIILQKENILYFLEVFLPLAFLSFLSPGFLFMTIPTFAMSYFSLPPMGNTGSRYNAYLIPFIFASAILGFEKLLKNKKTEIEKEILRKRLRITIIIMTLLCTLFIDNTPFRIPFKTPVITENQRTLIELSKTIPPEATVTTQVDIYKHVNHRLVVIPEYVYDTDYLVTDETTRWYKMKSNWDKYLPQIISEGKYKLIYNKNGIKIYKLKNKKLIKKHL